MRARTAVIAALAILAPLSVAVAQAAIAPPSTVTAAASGRASITIQQGGDVVPGQAHALNVTVTHCPSQAGRHGLTLEAHDAPPWLNVTFHPETFRFHAALPDECESSTGTLLLEAGPGAPGFTLAGFKVRAVDAQGAVRARTDYAFRVGHYSNLTVAPPWGTPRLPDGGHTEFTVRVANHGNADAMVTMDAVGLPDGVRALLPPPAVVAAPGEDGEPGRRNLVVSLVAQGDAPSAFDLQLVVTSHFTHDPSETGDGGVYAVRVEPGTGGVPPAIPALGLGAAGLAAVFMARRYLPRLGGGGGPTPAG